MLPFILSTDGSGNITGGSWSGSGTVQGNVSTSSIENTPGAGQDLDLLVDNVTSGTLTLDQIGVWLGEELDPGDDRGLPGGSFSMTFELTVFGGGTADLWVNNSAPWDGGKDKYNSFGVRGFSGNVTGFEVDITYSAWIGGRDDYDGLDYGPMFAAVGLVDGAAEAPDGALPEVSDFDLTVALNDVYHVTNESPLEYAAGVPSGAEPWVYPQYWGTGTADRTDLANMTTLTTANGFPGLIGTLGDASNNFLMVRGYDLNGDDEFDVDPADDNYNEADQVYVKGATFTVDYDPNFPGTADPEFIPSDAHFTFSIDGERYATVPEPGAAVLVLLASLALPFRRRRRRSPGR